VLTRFGGHVSRYRGHTKTHLQVLATATAINVEQVVGWGPGTASNQGRQQGPLGLWL